MPETPITTWLSTWDNVNDWADYGFNAASLSSDAQIGNYIRNAAGSPHKRWNKDFPITVYGRVRATITGGEWGGPWLGFSLYSGEGEYWGFSSFLEEGILKYYCNAKYFEPPGGPSLSSGGIYELQLNFDGNRTTVFKMRVYGASNWITVGTLDFKPEVHPSIQINSTWNEQGGDATGYVDWGLISVTGSEIWEFSDVINKDYFARTNATLEWGIETVGTAEGIGLPHYYAYAGGLTVRPVSNTDTVWTQGVASTPYQAGYFSALSEPIGKPANCKFSELTLAGALRGSAVGSYLKIFVKDGSGGDLISDTELPGNSSGFSFNTAACTVQSLNLFSVTATSLRLEVQGYSSDAVSKNWPDASGITGPPILKQAAVSVWYPPSVTASPAPGTYSAAQTVTLTRANFAGGAIYCTLDGSDPTTESAAYSEPITVTESTTLKVLAVDADGNQGEVQTFAYQIVTVLAFSSAPYTTFDNINKSIAIYYNTVATGVWQEQRKQTSESFGAVKLGAVTTTSQAKETEAVAASVKVSAAASGRQKSQTVSISGTVKESAVIAPSQLRQAASASATVKYSAQVAEGQARQSQELSAQSGASTATIRFADPNPPIVDANGVIHYTTEEVIYGYAGSVEQMQPLQQAVILAGLLCEASTDEAQKPQQQAVSAGVLVSGQVVGGQATQLQEAAARYLAPGEAFIEQRQARQGQAIVTEVGCSGTVDQWQKLQTSARVASFQPLKVSVYDPIGLSIWAEDPLSLHVVCKDPLRLKVIAS